MVHSLEEVPVEVTVARLISTLTIRKKWVFLFVYVQLSFSTLTQNALLHTHLGIGDAHSELNLPTLMNSIKMISHTHASRLSLGIQSIIGNLILADSWVYPLRN